MSDTGFKLSLPECYIYLYHTDEYLILPQYPESISDSLNSSFTQQNALARTAPVFAYSNSGPRTINVELRLHRDMMTAFNKGVSNVRYNKSDDIVFDINDDYVDILIKKLQSIALPKYQSNQKMVTPPMVAIRFGNDIFIKGVVASGGVTVSYNLPLLDNNKYAQVGIAFTVSEIDPYDADSVGREGSFRGITNTYNKLMKDKTTKNVKLNVDTSRRVINNTSKFRTR